MTGRGGLVRAALLLQAALAVGGAEEAELEPACAADARPEDAEVAECSMMQTRRPTGRKQPDAIYEADAWHLSEAGRQLLLRHPASDASALQRGAASREPAEASRFGEDTIVVHYSNGFFGPVEEQRLTAEQCELPCARSAWSWGTQGFPDAFERADILVDFPIHAFPPKNDRGAPAVAHSMEAAGWYGSEFAARYNGTANTSLLSTVPWPYFGLRSWREIQSRSKGPQAREQFPGFEERLPAAVFVARNCNGVMRNQLIEELVNRGVTIHSISGCCPASTEQSWPDGVRRSDKIGALRRYRVYLALENNVQRGYVTEKAIDGFAAGAVPLYLGAPDVDDYVPREGYISAAEAMEALQANEIEASKRHLDALAAKVKKAIGDESTWRSYIAWRGQPLERLNGGELARRWAWSNSTHELCRLCRFAYARLTPGARWDHARQQVVGGAPPPAHGDTAGWAAWRRGTQGPGS